MPKLADELGQEYMDQFYKEAMFVYGSRVHQYKGHIDPNTIVTSSTSLRENELWVTSKVPSSYITSMSNFQWPKLGYRQFITNKSTDRLVYYITTMRSAMRGLKASLLIYSPAPPYLLIPPYDNPKNVVHSSELARRLFNPLFMKYSEGLNILTRKESAAVALSEDFALCIPVTNTRAHAFDVLYKGQVVGSVDEHGAAKLPNRLKKRHSVYNLFEGRINL